MGLTLKIENMTSLPDGGPLSASIKGKGGLDIGRDQHLDWTLPDPSRYISSKHCEVRWRDGGYWLHDISTNGTFLDGAGHRLKEPWRLRNGDRFVIGHYVIAATIDGEEAGAGYDAPPQAAAPDYENLWASAGEAPPPIDPKELKPPRDMRPVRPDYMDWAVDVPEVYPVATPSPPPAPPPQRTGAPSPWDEAPPPAADDMDWARGPQKPPLPEPEVVPVPQPRRPGVWISSEPEGPWASKTPAPTPAQPASPPPASLRPVDGPEADATAAAFTSASSGRPVPAGPADSAAMADFVRLFARGAGLPEDALASRNPAELAEQLGQLIRLVTDNMTQLLEARQAAKRLSRSSSQTMIQALNNNPLKFSTSTDEALARMLGPQSKGYLDARRALAQGFSDLKSHQVMTFSAMQQALRLTLGEFDPDVIENTSTADRGLAAVVGSRKARLWDIYVARWRARTQNHADGMLKTFMDYFADCYDREEK